MLGKELHNVRPLRRLTKAADRFQHGVIRFLLVTAVDALAGGDARAGSYRRLSHEGLDQSRLADARLAGDEDDLSYAG
jgi:hypothetical protein